MIKIVLSHYVYDKFITSIFDGFINTFNKQQSDMLLDHITKIMIYLPKVSYEINYEGGYTSFTDHYTCKTIMYDNFEIINIFKFDYELGVNIHEYNAILIGGMLLE